MPSDDLLSPAERDILTRTVVGEASNQSDEGKAAVAHVVLNRLVSGQYGNSVPQVVFAPNQFEPWNTKPRELLSVDQNSPQYKSAANVVDGVLSGQTPDPTGGATHFLNADIVRQRRGGSLPDWAQGGGKQIGAHTFYAPNGPVSAADAINGAIGKGWSGQEGAPTDIGTALGYTGQPDKPKAAAVSDASSSDFFKDMGIDPNAKKAAAPASTDAQGSDFFKDMGITPKGQEAPPASQKGGSTPAIPPGDAAAAIGSGIGDLPIVGPYVKEGMIRGAAALSSAVNPALGLPVRSADDIRKWDAQLKQDHPYGYMGGQALGTGAALLPLGGTALGGVALGARAPAFVTTADGLLPALARTGAQAGIGGTTNALISAADAGVRGENPLVAGALGGAFGVAGPVAGNVAMGVGRIGRSVVEPFLPNGPARIADRFLAKGAAGQPLTINPSLVDNVPGSTPTLAEATGNAGIAGIERAVRSTPEGIVPFNLRDTERQAARGEVISGVRGDPASLEGMIADRQAATDPLREAAFADAGKADPSDVVKKIDDILAGPEGQRDAVAKSLSAIRSKLVKGGGEAADPMAAITGSNTKPPTLETDPNQLYGIRKAIGDILDKTGPKTENDARLATSQLMDVKNELDKSITEAAPKFSDYRDKFAEMSQPINADKWMQGLNLADMRGKVTLGNVDRAIKSTEAARARGGANDAKSVPDEVMNKLYGLRNDLRSQLDAAERGRAAGSPTVQNLATQNFVNSAGIPLTTATSMLSGHPWLAAASHMLNRAIDTRNPAVNNALINRLLTPELPGYGPLSGTALPQGASINPGAFLAPALVSPNRNRLTGR